MSDLDLHGRLREESRALAPPSFTLDGVQRAGRARRRRRLGATGAGLAVVVALAGLALAALPAGDRPPPAEAPPFGWDLGVVPDGTVDTEVVRDAVAGSPLVAEARLTPYDQVRRGSEIAAPPLAEPDSALSIPVVVAVLAAGADPDDAELELAGVDGVAEVWPSPRVAHPRLARFFDGLRRGADVLGDGVEILQPAPGPEPAFDLAGLGRPAPLLPIESAAELTEEDLARLDQPGDPTMGPDRRHPLVHVGALESGHRLVVYGNAEGNLCEASFAPDGVIGSGCDRMFAQLRYGPLGSTTGGGTVGVAGTLSLLAPEGTSVVAATAGGAAWWQRPVAGYAYFALPELGPVELVAYAADGTELGRWEYTLE